MAKKSAIASDKMRIRLKAYDHVILEQSAEKIVETAKRTGAQVSGPIPLPTKKEIITILRSLDYYDQQHYKCLKIFQIQQIRYTLNIHLPLSDF